MYRDGTYRSGDGLNTDKDFKKAKEYYQKAIDMGNVDAYIGMGFLYQDGEGVKKDHQKAKEYVQKALQYWQKAAKRGDSQGYLNLAEYKEGDIYEGMGVKKTAKKPCNIIKRLET
ncbi:tetratricopeptide repeat protein [Helicobacter suis]|uniref:tetratricopeptide repeat protein n=1 Tax=Helicobacter suis TaxID=104628 RepID=UPI0013D6FC66|nr:SEL1-like repeat protein [Helicobacter suis]